MLIFWKVLKVLLSVPSAELGKNLLCVAQAVSPAKPVCLEPRGEPRRKDWGEGGPRGRAAPIQH